MDIAFFKKLKLPQFSLRSLTPKPSRVIGIDIGIHSTKVVQLKYDRGRAILETYGELLNSGYLKSTETTGSGFLRYRDNDIATILKDIMREANVSVSDAVISIPASSSFITTIYFPRVSKKEINQAVPYEARKYIPIPISETVLDWDIIEENESDMIEVLLVAVPKEILQKFKRVAGLAGINPLALEVETLSLVRSLVGQDPLPTAIINLGYLSTTLALVDKGRLRVSHNFGRGSHEFTRVLERGLNISQERAEAIKKEVGLSEKAEEREISSVIIPLLETLITEAERLISVYNRKASRKIQKINLTGGGSHLKGLIEYTAAKFGLEVTRGDPFSRIVTPAFLQPMLREIGPNLSVAVGLALHEITIR